MKSHEAVMANTIALHERISDYEALCLMQPALKPMSGRGSHTQVYSLDGQILGNIIAEKAGEAGLRREQQEAGRRLGQKIASRFLLKVGNIYEYVVKLAGKRETIIRRNLMSEAFGPIGYNLAPVREKVLMDARDAVRQIPYLGFGTLEAQCAPDVLEEIKRAVCGLSGQRRRSGLFLVEETFEGRRVSNIFQFLLQDPYFQGRVRNKEELTRFQRYLRDNPLDAAMRERLSEFFEAPMTVGFRDVLRFLEGSRHPGLGWEAAEKVIQACFEKHGTESFLPPEINYYTNAFHISPDKLAQLRDSNEKTAKAFALWFVARAPLTWTMGISDRELERLAYCILDLHHDYPVFEIEPYSGLFSAATLRLFGRVLLNGVVHLTGLDIPERRNALSLRLVSRYEELSKFFGRLEERDREAFLGLVNNLLVEMTLRGGVPGQDGNLYRFQRIGRTFYSFQERAEFPVASRGRLEEVITLEDLLWGPKGKVLERYPDIPAKLLVFFVLIYRYFLDTGHVPDLRPDDAGRDLFIRGIWGYKTRNLLIAIGSDASGNPHVCIRFVDNKDQFKQYRRVEDRAQPLGLGKYGLRLVYPIVQPAMERSIGMFAEMAAQHLGVTAQRRDLAARFSRWLAHLLHAGVDAAAVHLQAVAHDLIDDTASGLERLVRRWL